MRRSLGFWAMTLAVVLRGWVVGAALVHREPGKLLRVMLAATALGLYVAVTAVTVRRVQAADPESAAAFTWMIGAAGLMLTFTVLLVM